MPSKNPEPWRLRSARPCAIATSLVLLASCAQVGDYQRPQSTLPKEWKLTTGNPDAPKAAQTDWRTVFQDETLQGLIAQALESNLDLQMALMRVTEARAQYGIASAERLPSANLSATNTRSKIPAAFTGTDRPVTTQRAELSLTAVSFELDFWGRVANASEAARASYLGTEAASRALRISMIADLANLYYMWLELSERIEITLALIESRSKTLDLIRQGVRLGDAARSEELLAEGWLNTSRAELTILQNQRDAAEHGIALLLGKTVIDLPPGKSLYRQNVQDNLAPGIPSEVLYARPDVIAAEYRLQEAHANVRAARAAFLPRILLTAGLGFASPHLAKLFAPGTNNWIFQPAMSLPLFDGGRTAGFSDIADARKNSAVADYEKTIQQAFREVADLLSARASLAEQQRATEVIVSAYRERLVVAEARFKGGSASYLEVLDSERDLYSQQQNALQVRRAQLTTAAQLYKALGGGSAVGTPAPGG